MSKNIVTLDHLPTLKEATDILDHPDKHSENEIVSAGLAIFRSASAMEDVYKTKAVPLLQPILDHNVFQVSVGGQTFQADLVECSSVALAEAQKAYIKDHPAEFANYLDTSVISSAKVKAAVLKGSFPLVDGKAVTAVTTNKVEVQILKPVKTKK